MNELLKLLDSCAYNHPETVPLCIVQSNCTHYRLYFRYMSALYSLYRSGVMDKTELEALKHDFIKDFSCYEVMCRANLKTIREVNMLCTALTKCRKNADICDMCAAVSSIWGHTTTQDETEVNINAYSGNTEQIS